MAELVTGVGWPDPDSSGARLRDLLPDDYFIVDSPTIRGRTYEAMVVGPQGLFVLHTRDWTGEIRPVQGGDWQVVLDGQRAGHYPSPAPEVQAAKQAVQAFLRDEFPTLKPAIHHLLVLTNPAATLVAAPDVTPLAATPFTLPAGITMTPEPVEGALPDRAMREELALALARRQFTATQRASKPFVFRGGGILGSGKKVWTIKDAVNHMDRHPSDGIYHLGNDTLAQWLDAEGATHLADLARQVTRKRESDRRVPLEEFLIGTGLVARPRIKVRPQPVNLGCIISGESCLSRVRVRKGRGRGYLFGALHTDEPWLRVEPMEFRGDDVQVSITADTSGLPISPEPWQADILVESSASLEPIMIPVRVRVMGEPATLNRYVTRPLVAALVAAVPGAAIGWALGRSGLGTPGWLAGLASPVVWAVVVGIAWAMLGALRGLGQRPAWPILYAAGRWLLRMVAWVVALALVAAIGYWLWTLLIGDIKPSALTFVLAAMALAALPATIGEVRVANLACDVPISTDRRFLVRPLLGAVAAIGLMLLVLTVANVAGPTYEQLEEQGTVEEAQTWLDARWTELNSAVGDFVDELYLRRYDRRAPAGSGTTPTPEPSPEAQ